MSPKTYWLLWMLFFAGAAIVWLSGLFTQVAAVVCGFIIFGMTFMGMMCVLPSVVSHSTTEHHKIS